MTNNGVRNSDIIEITIRDTSYAKIESYRVSLANKRELFEIIKMISEKYGIDKMLNNDFLSY